MHILDYVTDLRNSTLDRFATQNDTEFLRLFETPSSSVPETEIDTYYVKYTIDRVIHIVFLQAWPLK